MVAGRSFSEQLRARSFPHYGSTACLSHVGSCHAKRITPNRLVTSPFLSASSLLYTHVSEYPQSSILHVMPVPSEISEISDINDISDISDIAAGSSKAQLREEINSLKKELGSLATCDAPPPPIPNLPPPRKADPPVPIVKDAFERFGVTRRRLNCSNLLALEGFMVTRYPDGPPDRVLDWELATSYSWLVLCENLRGDGNEYIRTIQRKDLDPEDLDPDELEEDPEEWIEVEVPVAPPAIGVPGWLIAPSALRIELLLIDHLGVPPLFTHPICPFVLRHIPPKERLIDHNPPGMKSFQPMFQALLYTKPTFDMTYVHIVADVEFMSDLWSIVSKTLTSKTEWRYDFRQEHLTVIFSRILLSPKDKQHSTIDQLLATCTKYDDDFASSLSHYKVVRWQFGGIHCLIRFKADCYLPIKLAKPLPEDQMTQWNRDTYPFPEWYKQMRFEGFENLAWPLPGETPPSAVFIPCPVGEKLGPVLAKHLPRLYFTQQKYALIAFVKGDCSNAHKKNVEEWRLIDAGNIWETWENENKAVLQRFGALLRYTLSGISKSSRSLGSMVLQDGMMSIIEPLGTKSALHGGDCPEMPHTGREPIIHLWRTMGGESLPEKWQKDID